MSEAPPRPPPPPESLSQHMTLSARSSAAYDTPPPPPPKSQSPRPRGGEDGPPPPPLPPGGQVSNDRLQQIGSPPPAPAPPAAPVPSLEDGWLPASLKDLSKADLEALLSDPALLDAVVHAPSTAHPALVASSAELAAQLGRNAGLATKLNAQTAQLAAEREALTSRLLQLRALERQWRLKQAAMDDALAPFSPKALHSRLVGGIAEQEQLLAAMEESFVEGDGKAGDREIADFVRRWREGRKLLALRAERRRRFEEGRVGGWR